VKTREVEKMTDANLKLSASVQMYLVTIVRLRENNQPVLLSLLAETLSISPVSANEMCRKLQDEGLVVYQPYKGASLTDEGEQRAYRILRRHRLWEVFLVENLGFDDDEAHDAACQLEHATSSHLADCLDRFLDYPPVNPEGQPIPRCGKLPDRLTVVLAQLPAGQRGRVIRCDLEGASRSFVDEQGIRPGVWLEAIATAGDSILVQVGEKQVSLAQSLTKAIQIEAGQPVVRAG
jgi:DtxR family Mn-dependent transcriptional regulator